MVNLKRGKHDEKNDETSEYTSGHWRSWHVLAGGHTQLQYWMDDWLGDAHCGCCCRPCDRLHSRRRGGQHWFLPHAPDISHAQDTVGQSKEANKRRSPLPSMVEMISFECLTS